MTRREVNQETRREDNNIDSAIILIVCVLALGCLVGAAMVRAESLPHKPSDITLAVSEKALQEHNDRLLRDVREEQNAWQAERSAWQAERNRRSRLFFTITRAFSTVISVYGLTQTDLVETGWFHGLTDEPVVSILIVDTAVFLVRRQLGKKYPAEVRHLLGVNSRQRAGQIRKLWRSNGDP